MMTQEDVLRLLERRSGELMTVRDIKESLERDGIVIGINSLQVCLRRLRKQGFVEVIDGYSLDRRGQRGYFYRCVVRS